MEELNHFVQFIDCRMTGMLLIALIGMSAFFQARSVRQETSSFPGLNGCSNVPQSCIVSYNECVLFKVVSVLDFM